MLKCFLFELLKKVAAANYATVINRYLQVRCSQNSTCLRFHHLIVAATAASKVCSINYKIF